MAVALLFGLAILAANICATVVLCRGDLVDDKTRTRQLLFIWLVPVFGAAISLMVALYPGPGGRFEPGKESGASEAVADSYETIRHGDHSHHVGGDFGGGGDS